MDIFIYFILGILTSVLVFLIGYASLGVFKVTKKVDNLQSAIDMLDRHLNDINDEINHRIDMEFQMLDRGVQNVQSNLEEAERNVFSVMDSRFDRLENKLRADVASGTEVRKVIEENQNIKVKLDDFIRSYQNQ